jgi:RimJ/RimL family protein N-acetyltransferase
MIPRPVGDSFGHTERVATNEYGQPIGADLTGPMPSSAPEHIALSGRWCRVVPLDAALHAGELWSEFASADDAREWTYLADGPFDHHDDLHRWIERTHGSTDPQFSAVIDLRTGRAAGIASLLRITPESGSIEVGHIHFGPSLQGTAAATDAMYLMMRHVFDAGYRRYEWKCDALNAPSRRAAERLGFTFEGVFRQATAYKGRNRDTAWFSILDHEWPTARTEFERWLDPANFHPDGGQRSRLGASTGSSDGRGSIS